MGREARLLVAISGIFALSFYGIQILLKVLYMLRLGYGPEYIGLFNASGALIYMSMSLPSGALGGRFGAARIMRIGGLITVLGMGLLPVAEFVPAWAQGTWAIGSQVVLTGGWSMLNVNLVPALTGATTARNRARAFALSGSLRGTGTFLGTIFGGLLPGLIGGLSGHGLQAARPYGLALWVGALLGLLALIPLSLVGQAGPPATREPVEQRGRFPLLLVALMIGYVYLSHGGWATCQAFVNAYMDADLALPTSSIGLISGAGEFLGILAPLVVPWLALRWGNGWTLAVTSAGTACSLLLLGSVPHWAAAGLGRLGVVALAAMWMPALQTFQMERVDRAWRSLAYGALSMAMGSAFASVSLVGGYVIAAAGYRRIFQLGVGLSVLGAVLMCGILSQSSHRTVRGDSGGDG